MKIDNVNGPYFFIPIVAFLMLLPAMIGSVGCDPPKLETRPVAPKLLPPIFARGDFVRVNQSHGTECGYILNVSQIITTSTKYSGTFYEWQYEIVFQEKNMLYNEDEIALVKRANWFEDKLPVHAESVKPEDFNSIQGPK